MTTTKTRKVILLFVMIAILLIGSLTAYAASTYHSIQKTCKVGNLGIGYAQLAYYRTLITGQTVREYKFDRWSTGATFAGLGGYVIKGGSASASSGSKTIKASGTVHYYVGVVLVKYGNFSHTWDV